MKLSSKVLYSGLVIRTLEQIFMKGGKMIRWIKKAWDFQNREPGIVGGYLLAAGLASIGIALVILAISKVAY